MYPSLLDNDQYKLTMQQALLKLGFGGVPVEYKFQCRTPNVDFRPAYLNIKERIYKLAELKLTESEHDYLGTLRYFKDYYLELLNGFRFNLKYVDMKLDNKELILRIKGPWFNTILFEVPILSIISEEMCYSNDPSEFQEGEKRLERKLKLIGNKAFGFVDFATRRRKSRDWHYQVVKTCKDIVPLNFIGTSNLMLAKAFKVKAIGTMAHEWLQAHQQLKYRVADSQKMALENWIKVYRGDLGIALSDVINTDAFLKDFDDPLFYKLFDGVREDSEPDPIAFGRRIIDFYNRREIPLYTKSIVFSNGLTFEKAIEIYSALYNPYRGINLSFGIGTNLGNDFPTPALNIVIKMVSCNGQPVAKISNAPSKGMCESPEFVGYLKSVYNVK